MIKYLTTGQAVEVLAETEHGSIVCDLYEGDDGPSQGDPRLTHDQLFIKPPIEKHENTVTALMAKEEQLTAKLAGLRVQIAAEEKAGAERLAKFKRLEPLSMLEDFIDGKITHYVELTDYGLNPAIVAIKDTLQEDSRDYRKKFKLLSLYGRSNGDLAWGLHSYYDGSGGHKEVYPCVSLDQAQAKATELITERIKGRLAAGDWFSIDYLKAADQYGVEVPTEVRASTVQKVINGLRKTRSGNWDIMKANDEAITAAEAMLKSPQK